MVQTLQFYVFSSNAAPFEPNQSCSPFAAYTLLEHNGDYESAARRLRQEGYGETGPSSSASDVDLSSIVNATQAEKKPVKIPPIPDHLMRVPGFVGEIMDFCLKSARYPSVPLAFNQGKVLEF